MESAASNRRGRHARLLHDLYPGDILNQPDGALQAIMRTIVMRANFIPAVRYRLGWRGVHACVSNSEAWTAKIADWAGVFGMAWLGHRTDGRLLSGRFRLFYFPDPEEELVERFSLHAAACTQQSGYLSLVRQFIDHPDLCNLFHIGALDLTIELSELMVGLNLRASGCLATRAEDGVQVMRNDEPVTLVAPGGWDQDLPAFSIAKVVYEVLGGSFAFCLATAPSFFSHRQKPGHIIAYRSNGQSKRHPHDDANINECRLEFMIDPPPLPDGRHYPRNGASIFWRCGLPIPAQWQAAPWWEAHRIGDAKSLDKQLLGIDERPSMIVLTGFLGSGKTSFIEHFVAYQIQRDRFVAVLQNEIGETGVDGKLLGSDNLSVTEIDEGCICCTLTGQLKPALQRLCSEFHPDFIILETTGLANPMNFLDDLIALGDLVRLDSVTTMVDAISYPSSALTPDIVTDQIKAADILLLNKVDGISGEHIDGTIARLKELNPHAAVIPTVRGEVNPGMLYSPDPRESPPARNTDRGKEKHRSHLDEGIESHKVILKRPLDRHRLIRTIEEQIPATVFRMKGILRFTDTASPMVVQFVAGRYEISQFPERWEEPGFLICIGQDISPPLLDDLFDRCRSTPRQQ